MEKFSSIDLGAAAKKLGICLTTHTAELTAATMPVAGNTQPYGLLHGGASALLAETVASAAASGWAQQHGKIAVGTNLSITHLKAVTTGEVTGVAKAMHLGTRTACYTVEITQGETLVAWAQVSTQLAEKRS